LKTQLWAGEVRPDDWRRETLSWTIGFEKSSQLRRQEEARWLSLPAGLERKKWAAALGKQRKILFVQVFFG
jgi:hypothetical protein